MAVAVEEVAVAVEEGGEPRQSGNLDGGAPTEAAVAGGEDGGGLRGLTRDANGDVVSPFAGAATSPQAPGSNGKRKRGGAGGAMDVDADDQQQAAPPPIGGDGAALTTNTNITTTTNADGEDGGGMGTGMREIVIEELGGGRREEEERWQGPSAGCTAVCALIRNGELHVANAGDSRCVLSRAGEAVALTQDHKPMDSGEYDRILKAGGFVADGRVNGSLNLSRALGDLEYKQTKELPAEAQMVTAAPEVRTVPLIPADEFLILACDGIWDVLTNQEAVDFARERLLGGRSPRQVCEDMCDHCLAPDTNGCGKGCDNMSVVLALFKGSPLYGQAAVARSKQENK